MAWDEDKGEDRVGRQSPCPPGLGTVQGQWSAGTHTWTPSLLHLHHGPGSDGLWGVLSAEEAAAHMFWQLQLSAGCLVQSLCLTCAWDGSTWGGWGSVGVAASCFKLDDMFVPLAGPLLDEVSPSWARPPAWNKHWVGWGEALVWENHETYEV